MRTSFLIAASAITAVVGEASAARASFLEVYIPAAGTQTFQGGEVAGSRFTAITAQTFNSLGFIDVNANGPNFGPDGLLGSYQVGIWLVSTQTLLASTTVTPASPLLQPGSSFRYAPIPPTTIPAGEQFIVGALLPASPLDSWLTNAINVDYSGITGPGFGMFLPAGTLSYPSQSAGTNYAVANASDAIIAPEPTTAILLSLTSLALLRRRQPATH